MAVSVIHWGEGIFHHLVSRGGLLVQLEAEQSLVSDRNWRVRCNAAYRQNTPRIAYQLPWEEQFDARLDTDWTSTAYYDADWDFATEILASDAPWLSLSPRRVPLLSDEPI